MSDPAADVEAIHAEIRDLAREVAREEIASLSGLLLRRLQDMGPTRSIERNMSVEILSELFGEALADFSGHTSSGSAPGEQ